MIYDIYIYMFHGAGIFTYKLDDFVRANFGKYSSTMEHMGYDIYI